MKKMTLSERVKIARDKCGLNQEQVALRTGKMSQQSIQKLEKNPNGNTRYILELARALEVSPYWLKFGEENDAINGDMVSLPVIEWESLNYLDKFTMEDIMEKSKEVIKIVKGDLSENCIGIYIEDDSMISPRGTGDSFNSKDLLIIDTSLAPQIKDFLLVKYLPTGEFLFRQLVQDAFKLLKPLNPEWDKIKFIDEDIQVLGVLVRSQRFYRKIS